MEAHVSPHPCWVLPSGPLFRVVLLSWLATSSQLKWCGPKGHDKLDAGIVEESHNKIWYKFTMGGHGPSKPREGMEDRDDLGSGERIEGASVPKGLGRMFASGARTEGAT
jgi:hypothetical protein